MGTIHVHPVGLGLAVDVMEMPVRLRVVRPQVAQDAGMIGIGVRADKMRGTVRQGSPGDGEAMVVLGLGLVEVGAEAESRAIRVGKRGQADPQASRPP